MQPRVLIICERAAERETIRVLVGTMGCQWVLASSIEEALAMLSRERISAALLELPGAVSDPDQIHKNVREFLVRFPGRVMALTDGMPTRDRKSTRLNSSHGYISYAVFCLKKKKKYTK